MAKPLSSRRWWQFRLRTLGLLVLLVSVATAYWAYEHRQIRQRRIACDELQVVQTRLTEPADFWLNAPLQAKILPLAW